MPKRNALRSRGGGPLDQAAAHSIGMRQSCEDAVNAPSAGILAERGRDDAIGRGQTRAAPPPARGAVTLCGKHVRPSRPRPRILPNGRRRAAVVKM